MDTELNRQHHQILEGQAEYSGLDPTGNTCWFLGRGRRSKIVFGKNTPRVVWSQVGMEKTKSIVKIKEP